MSASSPCVISGIEMIIVFYKNTWKKTSGSKVNDITRQEFIDWTNAYWSIGTESKKKIGHPAPFPLELPRRCIKMYSYVGDTILDPFMGSGTTIIVAGNNNRKAIGVELDKGYMELAEARIRKELNL